jgi:hypothetical protein
MTEKLIAFAIVSILAGMWGLYKITFGITDINNRKKDE